MSKDPETPDSKGLTLRETETVTAAVDRHFVDKLGFEKGIEVIDLPAETATLRYSKKIPNPCNYIRLTLIV